MNTNDRVRELITPLLADLGLELDDLELAGGMLRVTIDRPGGVDLDAIAEATRIISRELDHSDPIPGRYTLEVSSPGLERPLRTPAHFAKAIGAAVSVRTHARVEGERRVHGQLIAADDDGITVAADGPEGPVERRLRYDEIERARTVFEWAPAPKPGSTRRPAAKRREAAAS